MSKRAGLTYTEVLYIQKQICPVLVKYAPPIGEGNAHECPWCGGKIYLVSKGDKCELCGMPYSTVREVK